MQLIMNHLNIGILPTVTEALLYRFGGTYAPAYCQFSLTEMRDL